MASGTLRFILDASRIFFQKYELSCPRTHCQQLRIQSLLTETIVTVLLTTSAKTHSSKNVWCFCRAVMSIQMAQMCILLVMQNAYLKKTISSNENNETVIQSCWTKLSPKSQCASGHCVWSTTQHHPSKVVQTERKTNGSADLQVPRQNPCGPLRAVNKGEAEERKYTCVHGDFLFYIIFSLSCFPFKNSTRYIFSFHPFKRETADVVQIELQMSLCCFLRQMLGFCKVKVFSAVPVFVSETHENRFLLWNQGCDKYVKPSLCKQKHHRSHKARACAWIWIIVTSPY